MQSAKEGKQKRSKKDASYYGGEEVDEQDEELYKLHLKDCRRRQASLYPGHLFKSPFVRLLSQTPSASYLLVASGQSRLHLYLQQSVGSSSRQVTSPSGCTDFVLFQTSSLQLPDFPGTLEEEARVFKQHGFPLLVWPNNRDCATVAKYLRDHYPDCARWFTELHNVLAWLDQKWRPLAQALCLSTTLEEGGDGLGHVTIPTDCVAASLIQQRLCWYDKYACTLKSYFIHRRQFTPSFHHNYVHKELNELYEARQESLHTDSGFITVVGDRLLLFCRDYRGKRKSTRLDLPKFLSLINDPAHKQQCLHALASAEQLRVLLKEKSGVQTNKKSKIVHSGDEEFDADSADSEEYAEDSEADSYKEAATDMSTGPKKSFPNRPVTQEIMKNKGIVKYRHKRERNPRIHLRYKYRKACIRYRSRLPPIKHEDKPYAGETKGIRINLVKSHKFKRN